MTRSQIAMNMHQMKIFSSPREILIRSSSSFAESHHPLFVIDVKIEIGVA